MRNIFILVISLLSVNAAAQTKVEEGVSLELAEYRAATVSNVHYDLHFRIPARKEQPVSFTETVTFQYGGREDLQIDFLGKLDGYTVNGKRPKAMTYHDGHIVIPRKYLHKGSNKLTVTGTSLDKSLNRADEYLYTLFVPDHAHSVFPCFDQPDIKAWFSLSLALPDGWKAISNAEGDCTQNVFTAKTQTDLIPTYLFSFTAGKFQEQTALRNGHRLTALYRETDSAKVAQLPVIFDEIAHSIKWLEEYTGIPHPFQKYGFVILPGYQFGGMEHPGCIQYRDRTVFLGQNPTPDEELNRLKLIAHETAHIWFGDLVTMRWFNDVWTKEVFANFMADKISREQFPGINHDLNFLKSHYIPALATDRTEGTHPIQQPLDNLKNAGLLYGNIIYHKAPIMMRKLEERMGEVAFRKGLQTYLRRFSYGNATWDDLIGILDEESPQAGIKEFDRQWVKQKGVPVIPVTLAENHPLPNIDGKGYARYELADSAAAIEYVNRWTELATEESRLSAAMLLYENYLMHKMPAELLMTSIWMLACSDRNALTLSVCSSYLMLALRDMPTSQRPEAEKLLWETAKNHPVTAFRQQMTRLLSRNVVSPEITDSVYSLWKSQGNPLFNTDDYTRMAYHLAMLRPDQWQEILATQRARLQNDDQRQEFDFISRVCNPDTLVQKQLFASLLKKENRAIEPYTSSLLALLNSPLREPFNNQFITPGLDILEEIQRTGDIFFPLDWCSALLGGHRSDEARQLVQRFLDAHPDYPEALKNKLLQAAFMLMNRRHGTK